MVVKEKGKTNLLPVTNRCICYTLCREWVVICQCDQSTQDQHPWRVLFVSQVHPHRDAEVNKGTDRMSIPGTDFLLATGCPYMHPLGRVLVDQVLVHKAPPPPDERHFTKQGEIPRSFGF